MPTNDARELPTRVGSIERDTRLLKQVSVFDLYPSLAVFGPLFIDAKLARVVDSKAQRVEIVLAV